MNWQVFSLVIHQGIHACEIFITVNNRITSVLYDIFESNVPKIFYKLRVVNVKKFFMNSCGLWILKIVIIVLETFK